MIHVHADFVKEWEYQRRRGMPWKVGLAFAKALLEGAVVYEAGETLGLFPGPRVEPWSKEVVDADAT